MADDIYTFCENIDNKYGLITYFKGKTFQDIDTLGFICPFLSLYGRTINKNATILNQKIVRHYIQYGTNKNTGLPTQRYDILTKIPLGCANWARGFAWYVFGLMSIDFASLNEEEINSVNTFIDTIMHLFDKKKIASYPYNENRESLPDMSAEIPLLYFLSTINKINLTKEKFIKLISPFVLNSGMIGYSSPGMQDHARAYRCLTNDMAQGILFYLYNQLK
jgi:hypothetical protein